MESGNSNLIYVGGGKGGVGKNVTVDMIVDYMVRKGKAPHIVDSDNSNLDALQRYQDKLPTSAIHLEVKDGWLELLDVLHKNADKPFVVNTKAGNNEGIDKGSVILEKALAKLNRKMVAFWVINRDDSSWILLPHFLRRMPSAEVHVVINSHWGEPGKFELWKESKERVELLERNGREIIIPDVADRITHRMKNDPWYTFQEAYEHMPFSFQVEIDRVRDEVDTAFSPYI